MSYIPLGVKGVGVLNVKGEPVAVPQCSTSEWSHFRPLMKRLYVDENKNLKEVMAIFARDHGHTAT
jgi:hypothetical protein